jgi:hypothetical protein
MNSDSAIFCFGEENMNSYEVNKKRKDGAKIQVCAVFALCAKTAQDYLHKLRLAPTIKRKVLHCAATKTTLLTWRTRRLPSLTRINLEEP